MKPKPQKEFLAIGEACELTGFAASALRYYESIDLLEPDAVDPQTGYRLFHPRKLLFLNFLRSMKENGLGPTTLQPLVPTPDLPGLRGALSARVRVVRQQMKVLRRQLRWLTEASEKLANLESEPPLRSLVLLPPRFVVETGPNGTYDFLGYARARHSLVARVNRLDLAWKDDLTVRFSLEGGEWAAAGCTYSLEVADPGPNLPDAVVVRPAGEFALEWVRGPVELLYPRTIELLGWVKDQGWIPGNWLEWRHLISTAHTANPTDFLTEIAVSVSRK